FNDLGMLIRPAIEPGSISIDRCDERTARNKVPHRCEQEIGAGQFRQQKVEAARKFNNVRGAVFRVCNTLQIHVLAKPFHAVLRGQCAEPLHDATLDGLPNKENVPRLFYRRLADEGPAIGNDGHKAIAFKDCQRLADTGATDVKDRGQLFFFELYARTQSPFSDRKPNPFNYLLDRHCGCCVHLWFSLLTQTSAKRVKKSTRAFNCLQYCRQYER